MFDIINYLHNNVGNCHIGMIMDMFDIPTEKELLGQVKAHLETKRPVKTLDVNEVFPFWNAASVSAADTDSMRKPSKKGLVMPNDKVGSIQPIKTIKEWKAERVKGHKETTSEAQKEPEVKKPLRYIKGCSPGNIFASPAIDKPVEYEFMLADAPDR